MKKVVLLAGALATGMAVAPQAANAANPELNDVQKINLNDTQIKDKIKEAQDEHYELKAIENSGAYAVVDGADQLAIKHAVEALEFLIGEMDMIVDGNLGTNSAYFQNSNLFGRVQGRLDVAVGNVPDVIRAYNTGLNNNSTCNDFVTNVINAVATAKSNAKAAIAAYAGTLTPAQILDANATTAAGVDKTNLENILEEALDILGAYDEKYQDPAGDKSDIYDAEIYGGKDGVINTKFDATVKGHIEAAKQLIERIEAAKNKDLTKDDTLDDQLLNQFELQTDVDVLTPLLEGYVVTFKIEANHVAADNVKSALTEELGKLEHHKDCKHTDTHKVAEEIQKTINLLDPDAAWDAKMDLHDRANSNPLAVQAWEAHLNGTSIPQVSTLYKTALGWDVTDLAEAIDAFQDRFNALGDCDVKTSIGTFLWSGTAVANTVAKEFNDLKTEIMALGTTVTPAQFAALDQRVTNLFKRIANVEKAWNDLAKLNADDVKLQKEITEAATKDGYSSTTITAKWGDEQVELNNFETAVENAIKAITKDAEFTGYDTFKPTITLEYDHHKWLAEYQKENYDATQTMIAAIDVRWAEYTAAKDFKITTTEKGAQKLADGTEVYTTKKNIDNGYTLETTKGEKDPSKPIYASFGDHLGFSHIDAHFTDHISGLSGAPGHDGFATDIRYDRINKWYNDAEAQYLGSKNYVDDKWNEAERKGELINNTKEGLDVATTATDASAILVNAPAAKADVVFGWLQKEIQTTFAKAIENEKANKDIHDKYQEVVKYIADGQALINDGAKIVFGAEDVPACDIEVYDMATRLSSDVHRDAINWNVYMTHVGNFKGNVLGFPTPIQWNLSGELDSEKYLEEGWTTATPVDVVSYNPVFDCHHEKDVWGWNKIQNVMKDLEDLEKKEYDKVASLALLNGTTKKDLDTDGVDETFEETLAEVKENVDDITNEAYTQLYINGLAYVQQTLNLAKGWAKALDGICHTEDALKPCTDDDMKNNPCGWDEANAKAKLQAIINEWNAEYKLVTDTDHKGTEDAPEVNDTAKKCADFKAYVIKALNDIRAWEVAFAKADKEHKVKLNAALDLAGEEAHALHHYSYNANQALINYNDAEKAAVNLWAVDFSKRKIGTFNGEEVTFQEFVKKIDDKMIAEGAVNHTLYPDVYAAIKKFAEEPIANFQDYIDATEKLEGFIKAVAQVYCDYHQYTELKKLADGTKNFNWDADFQKAVDANNAAHVELLKQLAQAQATLDAAKNDVIADKNEVYPVDYTTLTTTNLKEAQDVLDAQKTNIEKAWKDGKAADYSANGNEDGVLEVKGYALDLTKDGKNVIDAYVEKAQAAKNLYAANKVAKEELLVQIQAILTNTNSAYEEVECAETAGCTQDFRTDLDNLKKALVGEDGNGGIKKEVNDGFAAKFAAKTAAELKAEVDALETKLGQVKKDIAEFNHKVLASADAKADILDKIEKAFGTEGSLMKPALAETGAENFKHVPATGEVRNTAKYFDEINAEIDDLKTTITNDDSHKGNHSALEKYNTYLQTLNGIKADLEELVQAIKDNETAHNAQLQHRDELYKKYECYDTTGLEAAVNGIADPDFSLDTEFPEVPGYPETAVDPAGKDHTKAHTAVAEAIKVLDAEIKKHYENGASNMDAAKTLIGEKETEYTTAFEHAQTNDSKFMEEYGKCTEAAKAVKYTYENWKADHFANGANKYSDEANVQVTKAYDEMVAAQKAYLKDIKTDWYNNEAVEKVANNEGLLTTYKEKINAYNAAVEKAQKNDQEFDKQLAAHVEKELTAEATYTDTRVVADPVYVTLKAQLTALLPECDNAKFVDIRKQIIQDWEDEKSALNGTAEAVAAYQAAAKKYNELMANLNAYGSQLVKYLKQSDAFDAAKTTIAGYDIMKPGYKDFDGNTEGAEDYNHKKDIEKAIEKISGNLDKLYGDMKTEATHVAETINDTNPTNNEVNDLNVDPAVGTIKTLIENLVKDAKNYEDACDANEAAFEPLHDNIKAVEADYAPESAKVTTLPEPAQEAFNLAVKKDLQDLAELQKDLEEAYMDEDAVNFTKDNTDYEDLKKEIEEMYDRAKEAGAHLGDVDFDGDVTVYDSDELVDIVLYNRGYAVRGDFDFNGENDVTDVERLNNLLWYEHIEKAWAPGRVAFEGDIELTAEGNTVALALNNNVQTNGIQFDVTVPEGAYIDNVLGTDRVEGMRVLTACIADNTYRVLVISTLNASTINDNEGAIVTFNVCGGNEVEVSNVIATDGNSHRLNGAAVSVGITTEIDEIATEGETDIFSLDGIRQSVMKAGVNIVRGANGVAKKIFNK